MKSYVKLILVIVAEVLQLIAANVPEAEAVSRTSAKFGVSEDLLRKSL